MAKILCKIDNSTRYEVYVEYSFSQDPIAATSTVSHALKLKQLNDIADFNGNMNVTYKIGSKSFTYNGNYNIDDKGNAGSVFTIKTGDPVVIQHDKTTGKGSFTVSCSGSCYSDGYGPGNISLASTAVTLTQIDRVAPKVTVSVSQVTANSLNLTAESHAIPDKWEYSLDDGSTWVQFSTSENKKVSTNISGLSPNVTYKIKVRAKRKYNQVSGVSATTSVKTLGNSIINSVNAMVVDVDNPIITMNWTVYQPYSHTLVIKFNGDTVLTISNIKCSVGTFNKSITLSTEERDLILEYMWDKKEIEATYELLSYDGNTRIGDVSTCLAPIEVSEKSAPVCFGITLSEGNPAVGSVAGENEWVKGYSILTVTMGVTLPINYAEISGYTVSVGDTVKEFPADTKTLQYGLINVYGDNVTIRVEIIDSRGYSTVVSKAIKVFDYEDVAIMNYSIRRKNEVESTVQLSFSGKYSPIISDSKENNGINATKFRYAPNGGNWSGWYDLTLDNHSGGNFSYSTLVLSTSSGRINFDTDLQYVIEIEVEDCLTTDTMSIILNKGTPLVAFRSKKVGINESNPTAALHVRVDDTTPPFKINNTEIDFVVASDTVEIESVLGYGETITWSYKKWNSGVAECWASKTYTALTCNKVWGDSNETVLYETPSMGMFYYPFQFTEPPFEMVSAIGQGSGCMLEYFNRNTDFITSTVCAVRPKSLPSMDLTLNFYVRGRWK